MIKLHPQSVKIQPVNQMLVLQLYNEAKKQDDEEQISMKEAFRIIE